MGWLAKTIGNIRRALTGKGEALRAPKKQTPIAEAFGAGPAEIAAAMTGALEGDWSAFGNLVAIFERYLLHDPHMRGEYERRKSKIVDWPYLIRPGEDDEALGEEIVDELDRMFRRAPALLPTILTELADAIGVGFAVVELDADLVDGKVQLTGARGIPQYYLRQDTAGAWQYKDEDGAWQEVTEGKVLFYRRERQGSVLKTGYMWTLIWYALFKNFTIKDWVSFLEVYGVPLRVGKYPAGMNEDDPQVATLIRAVIDVASDAGAVIPQGMEIDFIESAKKATSDAFLSFAEYIDGQVSHLLCGGNLLSDSGQRGARSLGDTQQAELDAMAGRDARDLAARSLSPLLQMMTVLNHGERPDYPLFLFNTTTITEQTKRLFIVQAVVNMGAPVAVAQIQDEFGIRQPDEGEAVLLASPTMQNPTGGDLPETMTGSALPHSAGRVGTLVAWRKPTIYETIIAANAGEANEADLPEYTNAQDFVDGVADTGAAAAATIYDAFIERLTDRYETQIRGHDPELSEAEIRVMSPDLRQGLADSLAPAVLSSVIAGLATAIAENEARLLPGETIDRAALLEQVTEELGAGGAAAMVASSTMESRGHHFMVPPPSVEGGVSPDFGVPILCGLFGSPLPLARREDGGIEWHKVEPKAALEYWRQRTGYDAADLTDLETAARNYAWTISGLENERVIDAAKRAIFDCLRDGATAGDFRKTLRQEFRAAGVDPLSPHHLRLVYRQNMSTALNAGRLATQRAPEITRTFPSLTFHCVRDGRERPSHRQLHGMTYPVDHEVWSTYYPPIDWNCRCWATSSRSTAEVRPAYWPGVSAEFSNNNPVNYWKKTTS